MRQKGGSQQRVARVAGGQSAPDWWAEARLTEEARAWRIVAATAAKAAPPDYRINIVVPVLKATGGDYALIRRQEERVRLHTGAVWGSPVWQEYSAETMSDCVLFALFLALECEDESRSLRCQEGK